MGVRLFEALYDNADTAFRALEAFGIDIEQDADFPDYHMHLPEVSAPRGRELFPHNPDGTRSNGATFMAALADLVAQRQIPVHLQHRAAGVIIKDEGRVVRTAPGRFRCPAHLRLADPPGGRLRGRGGHDRRRGSGVLQ
jgi:hypothetical protein